MKNKKILLILTLFISLAFISGFSVTESAASAHSGIKGGYVTVELGKPSNGVSVYKEFDDQSVKYLDGKLFAPTLCESKIVFDKYSFENFEAEVEMTTINNRGKFDSGIYFYGNNFTNVKDGCTAWEVNIEHGATQYSYNLKLHKFENGRWAGARKEVFALPYVSDSLRLKIVVNDGILNVYVNDSDSLLTYSVGKGNGYIGLRNFYAPVSFNNFKITAEKLEINKAALEDLVKNVEGENCELYTQVSFAVFEKALNDAKDALNSEYQRDIDDALNTLSTAWSGLVKVMTIEEANAVVLQAKDLVLKTDVYAKNSISSMQVVLTFAEKAIKNGDVDEISYWCRIIEHKLLCPIYY